MSMTQVKAQIAFFKLKSAASYRFYRRMGRGVLEVRKGQVLEVTNSADVAYFRSRPDVMVECNPEGIPLDQIGRSGHLTPGKPKSYAVYGRASKKSQAPSLPAPQPGEVDAQRAQRAKPQPQEEQPQPEPEPDVSLPGALKQQVEAAMADTTRETRPGPSMVVRAPVTQPGAPDLLAQIQAQPKDVTPIEEVATDGSVAQSVPGTSNRI